MQTRHAWFSFCSRAQARASTSSLLVFWGLAAGGCVLNTRPGDGLTSDGVTQSYQFGSAAGDGGSTGPSGGPDELVPCKNVALFVQHALPHLIQRCVECHDGTKLKAALTYYLAKAKSTVPADQQYTCDITLTSGVKLDDRLQSGIFTESDPARTDLEHDFKFPDAASFAVYRDAVMIWLQSE